MLRRIGAFAVAFLVAFSPVTPLAASTDPLPNPLNQEEDQGDQVSLAQMQAGQSQQQGQLQQQITLQGQIDTQLHDTALGFTVPPSYSQQIGREEDFTAQVRIDNSSGFIRSVYVLIAFTPPGATRPEETLETYHRFLVAPGGSTVNLRIPNAVLDTIGLDPGRYLVTFAAYNAFDERIGGPTHGFFGNPFTFGSIQPTFTSQPAYPAAIANGTDFESLWLLGNTGDTPDTLTLLTVITPMGTSNSKEFYKKGFVVPPGGAAHAVRLTAAELAAAGIGPGRYLVTFVAYDGFGNRIGGPGGGFFGNPMTIGTPTPGFNVLPDYTDAVPIGGGFRATFRLDNTGDAPDRVSLLTVITPVGATSPSESREFYQPFSFPLPVGGGLFDFVITPEELAAVGIGPGRWLVAFVAYDAFDQRIGGPTHGFFGKPLTIGTIEVGLPTAPVIPPSIGDDGDLSVDFHFTNTGDAPDRIYALLAFTPPGSKDSSATKEIYRAGIVVPPGGATFTFLLTAAQRAAAGIGLGDWLVTATAFNGADQRMQSYFGNPLTIGTASPALNQAPAYIPQIGVGSPLETDWVLSNSGTAPATVTLVVAVTPVAGTGTLATVEFKQTVLVPPGGGSFAFDIPSSALAAEGIGAGQYLLSFVALRPNGNRIGEFFGNLLNIGTVAPVFNQLPAYSPQIGVGSPLETDWVLGNTGDAPANVELVIGITPVGLVTGAATTEFSQNVVVPAGGGLFGFTIAASQLAAKGIGAGDYTVSFLALGPTGNHIGEFFGNILRIGQALPSIGEAPIYSNRLAVGEDFTSQWTLGNSGQVTAGVSLLTVLTRVGTGVETEFEHAATVPPGGAVVNDVITAAELAAKQIAPGDYTVAFILFDGVGNRVGEFFGRPLSIGEASPSLGQAPTYTDSLALVGTFESDWTLGNSGSATGRVTLAVVMTRVGSGPSVEFRRVVDVPPGGAAFSFDITAAERTAGGIGAGAHTVSFVAFDPAGNRIGEFFGRPLMFGTATPVFNTLPSFPAVLAEGSALQTDWALGNSGDAPADLSLVITVTPVGQTGVAATFEFDRGVVVPPGGGTFDFDVSAAELAAKGIGLGQHLLSFVAVNAAGTHIGEFFGNLFTIGTVEPSFTSRPLYTTQIPVNRPLTTQWRLGNTGNAPAAVTLAAAITPLGGGNQVGFRRAVTVPPGGGAFGFEIPASDLTANGIGAGQYTLDFVALGPLGNPIGEFLGNFFEVGEGVPGMTERPLYTDHITEEDTFFSTWAIDNPGPATAHVGLLVVLTPVNTADSQEFQIAATVPVGGSLVTYELPWSDLAAKQIGRGLYTVSFVLFDANDQRAAEFFGNLLTIDPGVSSIGAGSPSVSVPVSVPEIEQTPSAVQASPGVTQLATTSALPAPSNASSTTLTVSPGSDFVAPIPTQGFSHGSGPVTLAALFTPEPGRVVAPPLAPASEPGTRAGPVRVSKTVTLPPTGRLLDFRLTAGELSLLNLVPGLYRLDLLAFDGFGTLLDDNFFQALVEFLFG